MRISSTLESEICKMSALSLFNSLSKCLNALEVHEVNGCVCSHSLGKLKTFLISVYCTDIMNTHCMENCDADKTDRSATLNNNSAVEFQDSCCFCSLYSMYKYCTWLDEDTGIKIQVTYIKECRTKFSASDEDVISEPAVEFNVVIRKKSVYISAAYVLLVKVEHCDFRIIFEDHTCNDLISDFNRFTGCINLNVFTHFYDLAGSLMSENYRNKTKRVIFVLMSICSADTASLNFNKDVVVANFRKIILLKLKMFLLCHHCYSCFFRNCVSCRSSRSAWCSSCCRSVSCHAGENLFNDFFDIYIVHIHDLCSS